jgi:hypothetical protein
MGKYDGKFFEGKTKVETVRKTISKKTGKESYSGTADLKKSQSCPYQQNHDMTSSQKV